MTLKAYMERVRSLDGVTVTAGVQGTPSTTAEGEATPSELVQIALANEFGTDTIPARPFLRMAFEEHGRSWLKGFTRAIPVPGEPGSPLAGLRLVGQVMRGDVQASLRDGDWTPNADSTVKAKGSSQPLLDTGQLVQSIRSQIERDGHAPLVVA